MKQIFIYLIMLFGIGNCATYHMISAASIGDNVYTTVLRDSGNPYDPERMQFKFLKCKAQTDDSLVCEQAVARGMSEYAE